MQDQDQERSTDPGEGVPPLMDRRKGPRRGGAGEGNIDVERRGPDRRKRKPGLAGLFGAIFGDEEEEDE